MDKFLYDIVVLYHQFIFVKYVQIKWKMSMSRINCSLDPNQISQIEMREKGSNSKKTNFN